MRLILTYLFNSFGYHISHEFNEFPGAQLHQRHRVESEAQDPPGDGHFGRDADAVGGNSAKANLKSTASSACRRSSWRRIALLGLTGWSATTDLLRGYAWPVHLHAALAWVLLILIALHVGAVLLTSWQHRENLVAGCGGPKAYHGGRSTNRISGNSS